MPSFSLCALTMLIIIPIVFQLSTAFGNSTMCKAVGVSNNMAAVTCTYPLNLNKTKRSFCLIYYEGSKKRTDVVTACSWDGAELLCVFEEGFHFRRHAVSNEFTVELPMQKGTGEFSCDTIPPDMGVTVEKCSLPSTDAFVNERVSTTTTTYPSSNTTRPATESEKCESDIPIIAVLGSGNVVQFIIIVLCIRRERFRSRKAHRPYR